LSGGKVSDFRLAFESSEQADEVSGLAICLDVIGIATCFRRNGAVSHAIGGHIGRGVFIEAVGAEG
jgi:hypothetical protein